MFPDQSSPQHPVGPASLPPVQGQPLPPQPGMASTQVPGSAQSQSVPTAQLPPAGLQPAAMPQLSPAATAPAENPVDQLKRLIAQYGSNPYAFNAAFQQLKAQHLAEQFHIVPSTDK